MLTDSVASTGIQNTRTNQIAAWKEQILILKRTAQDLITQYPPSNEWDLILEYELPRRQKRPDAIVLADEVILVVEFKIGSDTHDASARWQVEDYCLNLRDFHAGSAGHDIVPILCATKAISQSRVHVPVAGRAIVAQRANSSNLGNLILSAHRSNHLSSRTPISGTAWMNAPYRPILSVIEAAELLYKNHDVREISHSYASNLSDTTDLLAEIIRDAKLHKKRCVCFVTGVPGAGKTLTGLNVVHDPALRADGHSSGTFLSGNGPLVKVVRKALVLSQNRAGKEREKSEREVSTFIQNVHQFLRYHRENPNTPPNEHVVVFDEAQRAWDRKQMSKKQKVDSSEAAELFDVMDRLENWAVIIALVGGGQEIFLGEAGLEEWGRAVTTRPHWLVIASPEVISGGESVSGHRLFENGVPSNTSFRPESLVHLRVGVRSIRAQQFAEWVNATLNLNIPRAKSLTPDPQEFPLVVTRNLESARSWLRARSQPLDGQRSGLVATSDDQRLRAYGLERSSAFRQNYSFENWFLNPPTDVRSSHMLEVAASEFECQGLELDWVGLCWGRDLTPSESMSWEYQKFRGTKWNKVKSETERNYVRNRYRVLLTRARLGMVIWVPPGLPNDATHDSARFDRVYDLLKCAGVADLNESEIRIS